MKLRRLNNIIHRDLGYLCFGLTILYVISGVAVNHIHEWNPTYKVEHLRSQVDLTGVDKADNNALALTVLGTLGETSPLKNIFRVDNSTLKIFVVNNNITVDVTSGMVSQEKSNKRPLLYQANFLHLNHAKKWWNMVRRPLRDCPWRPRCYRAFRITRQERNYREGCLAVRYGAAPPAILSLALLVNIPPSCTGLFPCTCSLRLSNGIFH